MMLYVYYETFGLERYHKIEGRVSYFQQTVPFFLMCILKIIWVEAF